VTTLGSLRGSALQVIDTAREADVTCRLFGSLALAFYVPLEKLSERPRPVKDIDLIARSKDRRKLQDLMKALGWSLDETLLLVAEKRETYYQADKESTLDLYYDEIDGNHELDLRGRLSQAYPTLSVIDLLLTKLQRQRPRPEDLWDISCLLKAPRSKDDVEYFSRLLARDWRIYTTVTDNLRACCESDCVDLLNAAVSAPKGFMWHLRALVGRRLKWWNEVYRASTVIPK
jgi:hypothetical protein